MFLECFPSFAERQKPTANGLNKPMQNVSYALLETAIEKGCGKRCS